ncbi:MAG TPA: outer membrane protein assembly factor BamA [Bryobacteraceae bacterium]|nr:outer membrane protein assembly factor BamA [Bryobacteraceae bacterium]
MKKSFRLQGLRLLLVCLSLPGSALLGQQAAPQQPAQPPTPPPAQNAPSAAPAQQTNPPQQQNTQNPFETVPTAPQQAEPQQGLQTPPQAQQPASGDTIESIEFRGSRRVPQDTLRALIYSKPGDRLDEDVLHRDFMALWNTNRFDDIRLERERGKRGWIIRFVVVERPVIRSITYEGNKSVSVSDILDRYKERKVGLSVESQYDPNKIQRAKNTLQELESERGHQFATVTPEIHPVPPSSLNVVFRIDEGPKVKVGKIDIAGNKAMTDRQVIRAMKNLHPIGIPYSILFENLFARTFDQSKLEEDEERVRQFYMDHGYLQARVESAKTHTYDVPGGKFRFPLISHPHVGKRTDINLAINEGRKYHLNHVTFSGVKLFRTPQTLMRPLFAMSEGDTFSTAKLRKGIENMRKLYGEFGYIDFVGEPDPEPIPGTDKVDLNLSVDEGHQFFVRRIDFQGNTTTRDKVIRRELMIDEGDLFNSRLWDLSILRLNQLGYFEPLKENEAATLTRDPKTDTVDITLKVKERGKNSIQLNGGVSGIAGTFLGMSYATNNFLGLGETLSISAQLGTILRSVQFGFTEPYLFGKPMQGGFTVYTQRYNFNQAQQESLLAGTNLIPYFNSIGTNNLLNYISNGYGFTTFISYPLRRSFSRVGLTYGYDISNIQTISTAAKTYFDFLDFQGVGGPNSLSGIRTSKITPSYQYNTVDHPITPSRGKSLFATVGFSGSVLGGNVNTIEPQIDAKYFRRGFRNGHVVGMHFLGRFLTGYGGKVAPPFQRFYMGGENDIRGFDIWTVSPIAFIPSDTFVPVLNPDGTTRQQKIINSDGSVSYATVQQHIPVYQLTLPGGDTNLVANFEYRIPIFGPVILAPFFDAGIDKLALGNQLKLNPDRVAQLNSEFPQANFGERAVIVPQSQKWRGSTGLELQVMMPVVNAPFRLWWAYNPSFLNTALVPPLALDRSMFPNEQTYDYAVRLYGTAIPYTERHTMFRFSIGRTF